MLKKIINISILFCLIFTLQTTSSALTHTVKRGDNIRSILNSYGISANSTNLNKVRVDNGIRNINIIYIGQKINLIFDNTKPTTTPTQIIVPSGNTSMNPPVSPKQTDYTKRIKVNLSAQEMCAFEGDIAIRCSKVTTGKNSTPTVRGTFKIYTKQSNRWLSGANPNGTGRYNLHVDYWMPFYAGYGIHDACNSISCWRTSFGGNDYKWYGSHGCVNTPYDMVKFVWDWAPVGTPVIVY